MDRRRFGAALAADNLLHEPDLKHPSQAAGAVLALDVGKRRIGLAVSDQSRSAVRGLPTLERKRIREDLEKLKRIASSWSASFLLIGRPLHMSGDASQQSEYTDEFADRLSRYTELQVVFWDERLSSAHAERLLREAGVPIVRKDGTVDRVAAVLLLESYLEYLHMTQEQVRE